MEEERAAPQIVLIAQVSEILLLHWAAAVGWFLLPWVVPFPGFHLGSGLHLSKFQLAQDLGPAAVLPSSQTSIHVRICRVLQGKMTYRESFDKLFNIKWSSPKVQLPLLCQAIGMTASNA